MNKYTVRKLDYAYVEALGHSVSMWIDILVIRTEENITDAVKAIGDLVESGKIKVFKSEKYCIVKALSNGRERIVGSDVIVNSEGISYVKEENE